MENQLIIAPTLPLVADNGSSLRENVLSRSGYTGFAVYLAVVIFFSVSGNVTVILLYASNRSLHNVVNILLLNVSVADLSVAVLGTPVSFAASAAGHWLLGPIGCTWYGFICTLSGCAQIVGIAAVSLHRYFLVVKPFVAKRLTTGGALVCVGFTWVYSLAVALPPVLGWSEFTREGAGISCSVSWHSGSRSYTFFIFTMILAIPMAIILFSYSQILFTVNKMAKCQVSNQRSREAEKKVTIMIIVMVLTFLVAWTPYAALSLYMALGGDSVSITPLTATLPSMFAKASTTYNPVIYFLLHKKFRKALLQTFSRRNRDRSLHISPTESILARKVPIGCQGRNMSTNKPRMDQRIQLAGACIIPPMQFGN
ncbi:rhodopsin-like [Patiria miniata]|uniref:G-protein coupled receptors family 1 profile domain-containing protein n=1 Tax=Patiria miniata TaxID=46514 RepID=A0A914BG04_PATMI|nr:rhodopsin-like [Patiria miniata]